jgi:hypothetical protein
VTDPERTQQTEQDIARMIPEIRMDVDVELIQQREGATPGDIIQERSQSVDFVFLGLNLPVVEDELDYANRVSPLLEGLPSALLVRNEGKFRGRLV